MEFEIWIPFIVDSEVVQEKWNVLLKQVSGRLVKQWQKQILIKYDLVTGRKGQHHEYTSLYPTDWWLFWCKKTHYSILSIIQQHEFKRYLYKEQGWCERLNVQWIYKLCCRIKTLNVWSLQGRFYMFAWVANIGYSIEKYTNIQLQLV